MPVGRLDVAFYRDDIGLRPGVPARRSPTSASTSTDRPWSSSTTCCSPGRTIRAALDALNDHGRPRAVQLAVMVDRGHRELPIRPDFVGKNLPTRRDEHVEVGADGVEIGVLASSPAGCASEAPPPGRSHELGVRAALRGACSALTDRFAEVNAPRHPQGAGAAGHDRGDGVLRGLDPHPAVLRDRRQAPLGRHDDLLLGLVRRCPRASRCATPSQTIEAMGVDALVVRHALLGRALAAGPLAGPTPRSSTPATAGTSTPPRRLLDCYTICGRHLGGARPASHDRHRRRHQALAGWPAATSPRSRRSAPT